MRVRFLGLCFLFSTIICSYISITPAKPYCFQKEALFLQYPILQCMDPTWLIYTPLLLFDRLTSGHKHRKLFDIDSMYKASAHL